LRSKATLFRLALSCVMEAAYPSESRSLNIRRLLSG
jgi:hypothetical protein